MTSKMPVEQPTRVAVLGGGVGGSTLAVGLANAQRNGANIDFKVFEAAAQFKEIGAGVGVGPNAYRALRLLGLEEPYSKLAYTHDEEDSGVYFIWRFGEKYRVEQNGGSDIISTTPCHSKGGHTTVHRAAFLDMLVDQLPPGVACFNKRLNKYETVDKQNPADAAVRLHFVDGSTYDADLLLAVDGVKSVVRPQLLGDLLPASRLQPRFTGTTVYRGLVPMEELAAKIGDKARKGTMFLGKDKHILIFPIEQGRVCNIVVFSSDRSTASEKLTWDQPAWIVPTSREEMLNGWEDWSDDCQAILEALPAAEKWALHELYDLPVHARGPVCILGDAAAATLPHQGQGAAMAIESAYTLAGLLGHPSLTRQNAQKVLPVFDALRRERVTRNKTTSNELGRILEFSDGETMNDRSKLEENLRTRYQWIWSWDGESELQRGLTMLDSALGK